MLNINFIPLFDDKELIDAVKEYKKIWEKDGEKIIQTLEKVSGLSFSEKRIGAIVYEGVSYSGRTTSDPMKLRANYSDNMKKATLVHELGHRLLFNIKNQPKDLDEHQVFYLILYDVWTELYGEKFANEQVKIESARKGLYDYKSAWEWVLSMNKEERVEKFKKILQT